MVYLVVTVSYDVDVFGIRETISGEFLGFKRLASALWITQKRERLLTVIQRAAMSVPVSGFRGCILELQVKARATDVVKAWQTLGTVLRYVSANNALDTTNERQNSSSSSPFNSHAYYFIVCPILDSRM